MSPTTHKNTTHNSTDDEGSDTQPAKNLIPQYHFGYPSLASAEVPAFSTQAFWNCFVSSEGHTFAKLICHICHPRYKAARPSNLRICLELQARPGGHVGKCLSVRERGETNGLSWLVDTLCEVGEGQCWDILCLIQWVGVKHGLGPSDARDHLEMAIGEGYTKSGREATTLVDGGDPPSDPGSALAALSSKVSSSEKLTRSKPGRFTVVDESGSFTKLVGEPFAIGCRSLAPGPPGAACPSF
ncbi:hypothetical protein B0H14DRAFT_3787976 [Mycena olivaceomarginata]|nr:hypothetical protein B0H14DRAFT_3787976 [Mycena olivaceomarginata]